MKKCNLTARSSYLPTFDSVVHLARGQSLVGLEGNQPMLVDHAKRVVTNEVVA